MLHSLQMYFCICFSSGNLFLKFLVFSICRPVDFLYFTSWLLDSFFVHLGLFQKYLLGLHLFVQCWAVGLRINFGIHVFSICFLIFLHGFFKRFNLFQLWVNVNIADNFLMNFDIAPDILPSFFSNGYWISRSPNFG